MSEDETLQQVNEAVQLLERVSEDTTVPKNVKLKIQSVTNTLKEKTDISIRVNKALNELDEIADDTNLEPYARTQIWNIVSLLEKVG